MQLDRCDDLHGNESPRFAVDILKTYLFGRILTFTELSEVFNKAVLHNRVLLLCPPIGHLRQTFFLKVFFQYFALPLAWREKSEQILDTSLL